MPWQHPKPLAEDPESVKRTKAIVESPSYRMADEDIEFLNCSEARGPRLELDYLKPEMGMEQHNIRRTIVVFGGTRIRESAALERELASLREAQKGEPAEPELARRIAVTERLLAKSCYYDVAREFGRLVGRSGPELGIHDLVVMTGGGPGIMEAANRGASDAGAKTVGLNIRLPQEQCPNPYVTPDLCFCFHYFALRKMHFMIRARALVAFPGGYGTLDEVFEALTLVQTRTIEPLPIVLVGKEFWRQVVNIDFLVTEGVIDPEDRELFWYAETAEEIWKGILAWNEANGQPLQGVQP
ncbi:TIGR00730 family Rossman fold protein [candidate division WOR-3 bacterium]|nr:TIGR00730 family Rossman fold protein [candidate division WOR-3 bacterium]